jgi:hypothetical protein
MEKVLLKSNASQCIFTLVIKNNLGLAQLALQMHAFSKCVNGVLQLKLYQNSFELQVDLACATSYDDGAYQKPGPVSLFDLMHTLQKNPRLIPSHTVYSLNMERLISRLHHPGRDD